MLGVKPRTTEVHRIYLWNTLTGKDFNQQQVLSDILDGFFNYSMQNSQNKCAYSPNPDKIFWLSDYSKNSNIYKLLWNYSKTGRRLKIIEKTTLSPTKEKDKDEGDLEKQHALIKDYGVGNKAVMIFERIQGGITTKYMEDEINKYIKINFPKLSDNNIRLNIDPIISRDFAGYLYRMNRIPIAEIYVDKSVKVLLDDEDMNIADEDGSMRDSIKLTVKAKYKESLSRKYIERLLKFKKDSGGKIQRIVVDGEGNSGPIKLDTESIKLKQKLNISLDDDGNIDSKDIFDKYEYYVIHEFDDNLVDSFLLKNRTPKSKETDTM